jgi:transcription-repair coupling factor (superfamily II helicase)
VLGAEQHGHMDAVGYEMYLKLLGEAVSAYRKGEQAPPDSPDCRDFETLIDIPVDAYIPERYIRNEAQKLDAYRRISQISDNASYLDVQDELLDRYGELPRSVVNLLDIAMLKATAHNLDIISIIKKNNKLVVTFMPDARVAPDKLAACISKQKGRLVFSVLPDTSGANSKPTLSYKPPEGEPEHIAMRRILMEIN